LIAHNKLGFVSVKKFNELEIVLVTIMVNCENAYFFAFADVGFAVGTACLLAGAAGLVEPVSLLRVATFLERISGADITHLKPM